ncbi:MAG: MFS transporter [Clostridiales bacterium]|nr:MFS transporter [Clostridiales bacterium]
MNEEERYAGYMKGFIPFIIAAAVLSLCGGFTSAVPANIVASWSLDSGTTTWITLAYSLGAAAMAPIMGKLGDVFGRRRTLLLSLTIYGAGQLLIALCPEGGLIPVLLFRFLVGVGAAGIAPVVMAYIMMEFPQDKIGTGFSIYMFVANIMVIFGPTLGGIVLSQSGWRPVMRICVVFCVIALIACLTLVKKDEGPKKTLQGFDFVGSVFVLLFFSMFLSIPTFGQNNGWTAAPTLVCLLIGVISLLILIVVEKKAESPILNGRFMLRKRFIMPVIVLFLSQGLQQSCMTNIILFTIYTTGSRTLSGIATSVMFLGMALGTIVIGPMADKKEPRYVASMALVFVAAGAALQMLFTASTGLPLLCLSLFLIGLGLGGNGTIFMKVVLSGLDPATAGSGSGTYNVFRDMSAPFGVAVFVPLFSAGIATNTARLIADGVEEAAANVQACVLSLHTTAMAQVAAVVVGIVICLMLPKIYEKQ